VPDITVSKTDSLKNSTVILYKSVSNAESREKFDLLMKDRVERINNICKVQLSENKKHANLLSAYSHFYTLSLQGGSVVWCPVFKAASSNWMEYLMQLSELDSKKIASIKRKFRNQPNVQARMVAPKLSMDNLKKLEGKNTTKKLLLVRHPFDRLLSAFRDKLERCSTNKKCTVANWYYDKYGKKIVSKYREKAIQKFSSSYFSKSNNSGSPIPPSEPFTRTADLPSWWEFVQYVKDTPPGNHDEHWKPVSLYCTPCAYSFNYILHFENIQQEEKHLLSEIDQSNSTKQEWKNRNRADITNEQLIEKYFSQLDNDDILDLYEIYKQDFQLFGYQFQFRGLKLNTE